MARTSTYTVPREPRTDLEDLRDDTVAVVLNSKHTFKDIQELGGPTKQTLSKWLYKETKFPRLDTVRSILKICGYDLAVMPVTSKLSAGVSTTGTRRPRTKNKLPERKRRAKAVVPAKIVRRSVQRKQRT